MLNEDYRKGNRLLALLDEAEWVRIAPQMVPVDMSLGQVIYESGDSASSRQLRRRVADQRAGCARTCLLTRE